ncbi:acyltransferase family protein [Paenibacillus albus]|uniref:Acyltransferase n=1 Tax=Paenibacillus albus TaxID=2495582 RepID=A0A3S9ACC8_9BACL|nr:acyltransferase [Paenibacillus albus]AZN43331.1 acyltransferase [Paenibacillus albus]
MAERGRLGELDSLRGIASMSVVIYHSASLLGIMAALPWLYHTPLQILLAGHQAVIFFFLLSGFVLSLPFTEGQSRGYGNFIGRRLIRLYPPYIVSLALGLVLRLLFYRVPINDLWSRPIGWGPIMQHVVMIDQFHQQYFNPVIWSLVMEMRIALIFPFIIWLVMRTNWIWSFLIGLALSIWGIYMHVRYQDSIDFFTNYYDTAHYAFMFIVGAIIAKHRHRLVDSFKRLWIAARIVLSIIAFIVYTWGNNVGWDHWGLKGNLVSDWFTMLTSSFFIIAAIGSIRFKAILHWRPIAFVGRVSYSLYLVHLIVLLVLMNLFTNPSSLLYPDDYDKYYISTYWLLGGTVVISLALAALSYQFVEKPSMRLGRYLMGGRKARPNYQGELSAQQKGS